MNATIFREHLEKELIPFWNHMADTKNGGFYGYADDQAIPDKDSIKGCILNSRILWFYSAAYKLLKQPDLLNKAEQAFRFLADHFYDSRFGGVFWSVKADDTPEDTTKHTYNQSFAIYALSEYYQVTEKKEALNIAYSLYRTIENKCRDTEGYLEAFTREFTPASNEKLSENGVMAERTMNTLLHVLEAYTELYRADCFQEVGNAIREILDLFKDKVYDSERKICRVFFDKNYNTLIDLESYGHDIEASWLIDRACEVLDDTSYTEKMYPIIMGLAEGALEHGIDHNNNAMFNECENGVISKKKVWWVQAETVTGFYNAYSHGTDRTDYLNAAEKQWEYIQKHVIDPKSGEWYEDISPDNTVAPGQALVHPWKCPYHNGRMYIEMINRLSTANKEV